MAVTVDPHVPPVPAQDHAAAAATALRRALQRARDIEGLGAFITLAADDGHDAATAGRPAGVLSGVPIAVKDNLDTADLPTTGGTPALAGARPAHDHPAVARLRAAGAVVVGKTNLHELALGITSNNAHSGPVRNPHDPDRIAGGSSGGSAVAVATGVTPIALGSDTGGSVRIPASYCGVVGFRPTVGRWGSGRTVPLSSTRDTAGVLARTVADITLVDQVVTGSAPGPDGRGARLRLGVPRSGFWTDLHPDIARRGEEVLDLLDDSGVELVEVDFSAAHELDAGCGFPIVLHEVVRELPRYLATLPGAHGRLGLADVVDQVASPDVRAVLEGAVGDPVPEDAYRSALALRDTLRGAYAQTLRADAHRLDALVYPTVPLPPAPLGHDVTTPHNGREVPVFPTTIRNTAPGSTAGMPAITVPAGRSAGGLPIGISLEALPGEDPALLAAAQRVEEVLAGISRA
jgi:indoleacetamide hydrolase